jgi:FAD/FMN-containing dehydrogenase
VSTRREVLVGLAGAALLAGCGKVAASSPPVSTDATPTPTPTPSPAGSVAVAAPDWDALRRSLTGTLRQPTDPGYDASRELFNRRFDGIRPAAVASVASVADVQACVAFARTNGVPLAVRAGGHSYTGGSVNTGLVVDLRALAHIAVGAGTATIGAGAALVDVYSQLAAAGVSVPAGSCPAVGLAGLTLGGGMGVVARRYGLTSDRLRSAQVVLADGRAVTASATSEPDLYWALRGGGGSFGLVTELTLTTHPTQDLATFTYAWPWSAAADVLAAWQQTLPGADPALWSTCHLLSTTGSDATASVSGVYVGSAGDCTAAITGFLTAVGSPPADGAVLTRGYLDTMLLEAGCAQLSVAGCHVAGQSPAGLLPRDAFVAASDFFAAPIPATEIAALVAAVAARQHAGLGTGGVAFDSWGGAVDAVAPDATAFVHRGVRFAAQYTASWMTTPGNGPQAANQASLDAIKATLRTAATGAAYQNYADPTLADAPTAYYGANLPRLQSVKAAYDPANLFRPPQGISPA